MRLTTEDGLMLEADLYATGDRGGPAVVLLHMIPPGNDRSNYPESFISALLDRGLSVLNVDRRGAGDPAGPHRDAYEGPSGKLDALAARGYLVEHECAMDPNRIAYVGASNGTTTALDFAVYAGGESSLSVPSALVFLTGGTYTENQHLLSEQRALLEATPILFVYSTAERTWSVSQMDGAPASWEFREYATGDHGTRMFDADASSISDVVGFLGRSLSR